MSLSSGNFIQLMIMRGTTTRWVHLMIFLCIFVKAIVGNDEDEDPSSSSSSSSTVCYDEVGCFPTSKPWSSIFRPRFPPPQSPKEVQTSFTFFTRNYGRSPILGHGDMISLWPKIDFNASDFKANREKTYFITHGYFASGNSSWMADMMDALLNKEDANIFLVDWGEGASTISYFQAASNTRVVGAEIARFINYLMKKYKLSPSKIHLIGHSLGAHASSYAAKNISGIARLTGLDPAQPGFEGTPETVRLDKSDADFVDVYHTNCRPIIPTLGFGMISPVGHVDIYFNGGLDQPECLIPPMTAPFKSLLDIAKVSFKVLAHYISCSHTKAYKYFTATIDNKCNIWARRAGKLRSLINAVTFGHIEPITAAVRKCSHKSCTTSGFLAPLFAARGVFASTTIKNYPYCDTDSDNDEKILAEIKRSAEGEMDEEADEETEVDVTTIESSTDESDSSMISNLGKKLKTDFFGGAVNKTKSVVSKIPFI